jgi:predicted nucleic acid-binding protein
MNHLTIDAGPFIGLFYAKDTYHQQCVEGFAQLAKNKTILLAPIPIVFEVYKWLLMRTTPATAQRALQVMEDSLHLIEINKADLTNLKALLLQLSQWQGSLEDATVVLVALRYRCPVWTYNFRDFAAFKSLNFWTPECA